MTQPIWSTSKLDPQIYRNSWDHRFRTHDPRATITHLTAEEYRKLYLEVFKVTAPPQTKRILDYGCGTGLILPVLLDICDARYYSGADISSEMIHYCRTQVNNGNTAFRYCERNSFFLLPDEMESLKASSPFDFIICHSVLTHLTLDDGKELLKALHGLLEDGGQASISACIEPQQNEQIAGDWGRVVYGGSSFHAALREAGFEILSWFHSGQIEQDFFGVRKAGEK